MKKISLAFAALLIFFIFGSQAKAALTFDPASPATFQWVLIQCSTGDYWLEWQPDGTFDGFYACAEGGIDNYMPKNLATATGLYQFAECDSAAEGSNCAGSYSTIEDFKLDPGYVADSETTFYFTSFLAADQQIDYVRSVKIIRDSTGAPTGSEETTTFIPFVNVALVAVALFLCVGVIGVIAVRVK